MTRFPLRSLRLRSGEQHHEVVPVALQAFRLGGERYLPVPAQPPVELTVQRATGGDVFRLRFAVRVHGACMRCLDDAVAPLELDATEYHDAGAEAEEELRSEYVVDDHLELSAWARDAIALALPDSILCRPDCAGLCAACGKNLNAEPHEHGEQPGDPRWAALEALRDET